MALNFPTNPSDGDIYEDFYWDDAAGIWRRQLSITNLDDINDVSATTPTDGDFLTYDDATGNWINETVTYSYDINDLTSLDSSSIITAPNYDIDVTTATNDPGTLNLDFSDGTGLIDVNVESDLTFTGSNYRAGAIKTIRITSNASADTNLTFPAGWVFVGIKPTTKTKDVTSILTITSFGTTEGDCVAAHIEEL